MPRIIPTLCAAIILLIPTVVSAQLSNNPLVPCDGVDVECQACYAVELGQNIINFLVYIAAFIAVLLFAYAGFLMVTAAGNMSQVEKARGMFTNVLIGIIIVLVGWLVVDTVMKWAFQEREGGDGSELYNATESTFGPWNRINCVLQPEPTETAMDEVRAVPGLSPIQGVTGGGEPLRESEARSQLEAAGIGIKQGAQLDGVRAHVIQNAIALQQSCDCNIVITEGTGGRHQSGSFSHANGYKLDIRTRDNPELLAYVRNLPSAGSWSDGTPLFRTGCSTYAIESDHIDVVTLPSC